MQHSIQKIGIMGGTFNPVHCGHLVVAETMREAFCLDEVLFIPSGQPPHKPDSILAEADRRYEMVRLAIDANPSFIASRIEIDRTGFTYTVITLQALKEQYGGNVRIFFIIGADVIPELTSWRECRKVFGLCEFIAVMRPGYNRSAIEEQIRELGSEYGAVIHLTEAPLMEISSSRIRERINMGKSIKYLVPESVERYIMEHHLYRQTE